MKPCSRNREIIAGLALDALDTLQERRIRAHLRTCEGCRGYLAEISNVTENLAAAQTQPDIQTSASFHQRVVAALRAEESGSAWQTLVAPLRGTLLNWRVALPLIGATVVMIGALSIFVWPPVGPPSRPTDAQAVLTPTARNDLEPTISNYQMVANQSLEKLDELLTRQANRNPSPAPIYTASSLARASALD